MVTPQEMRSRNDICFQNTVVGSAPVYEGKQLYTNSWAILVGIDQYQRTSADARPPAAFAVSDAEKLSEALEPLGFPRNQQRVLRGREATKKNILKALDSRWRKEMKERDRLFVYFAGHSFIGGLNGTQVYFAPYDFDHDDYAHSGIFLGELREVGRRTNAHHVLIALDSCYSGYAVSGGGLEASGYTNGRMENLLANPVVVVLTASDSYEEAYANRLLGQGVFTHYLLKGLQGRADHDNDHLVSSRDLAAYIWLEITGGRVGRQNPKYRRIDGSGEFFFVLPKTTANDPDIGKPARNK